VRAGERAVAGPGGPGQGQRDRQQAPGCPSRHRWHLQRFGYRYSDRELEEWAPRIAGLAGEARETRVLFNNCYRDYAQVNAGQPAALLRA
jgi:uncharacterized protein YecE (DUF72 family)